MLLTHFGPFPITSSQWGGIRQGFFGFWKIWGFCWVWLDDWSLVLGEKGSGGEGWYLMSCSLVFKRSVGGDRVEGLEGVF